MIRFMYCKAIEIGCFMTNPIDFECCQADLLQLLKCVATSTGLKFDVLVGSNNPIPLRKYPLNGPNYV